MKNDAISNEKDKMHELKKQLIVDAKPNDHIINHILLFIFTLGIGNLIYLFYAYFCYFESEEFLEITEKIKNYTKECNELNDHVEELKNSYIKFEKADFGQAEYIDNSLYNYKRPELKKMRENTNIYNCSRSVCKNAKEQPFKYLCKYFDIKPTEKNLEIFEKTLNDFSAAEQGKKLLKKQRDEILISIIDQVPFLIIWLDTKQLIRKLGFQDIDFSDLYFPKFSFNYISSGGNSSMQCNITLDLENLERFIDYLSKLIKFKKSIAGQRALMTSSLREKIKERDNYTCQHCGLSTEQEPNLLLEIDHIIPLSKNGLTTEDNLQTLCWKCNRSKGAKIISE